MARRNRNSTRGGSRGRQQPKDTETITGIVEEVHENRWGNKTLFNLQLDTGDSVGIGEDDYGVQEGDEVSIECYENARGYLTAVDNGVTVVSQDPRGSSERSSGRGSRRGNSRGQGGRKTTDKAAERVAERDSKRRSKEEIVYETAAALAQGRLHFLVEQGVLSLGTKTAKAEDKESVYNGLLDQFTAEIYNDLTSRAALERAGEALSGGEDDPDDAGNPDGEYDN